MQTDTLRHAKALFFDVGDTLYVNEDMEKAYPRQLVELIARTRTIEIADAKQLLSDTTEALNASEKHVTKVRAMKELGFTRAEVHEAFCKVDPKQFLSPDPALAELLRHLSTTYRLGVISNFKRAHLAQILQALGLEEAWFPLMVTEDIVQEIKPDPEPFLKAIELAAVPAGECVYVGDSPSKDMRPAKEVGMLTILVKKDPVEDDLKYADACISVISELKTLLEVNS